MLVSWCHCRAANRISPVPEQEALEIGVEAYVYGYPLVTMEMTRRVMTNVAASQATKAPMGQFANLSEYPTATFKDVTAPNADTLYSVAWLDLSKEAYVLHVPDEAGRYYLMPALDGWTNVFASPGKRTAERKQVTMSSAVHMEGCAARASCSSSPPRTWYGSSAVLTPALLLRTSRKCMRFRTNIR